MPKVVSTPLTRKELFSHPLLLQAIEDKMALINESATGSSTFIKKWTIAFEPPSIDIGEITDKGSLNQRMVLRHRANLVQKLFEHGN